MRLPGIAMILAAVLVPAASRAQEQVNTFVAGSLRAPLLEIGRLYESMTRRENGQTGSLQPH